ALRRVLPRGGARLRLLLAVPRAGRPARRRARGAEGRGGAGSRGRRGGWRLGCLIRAARRDAAWLERFTSHARRRRRAGGWRPPPLRDVRPAQQAEPPVW